MEYKKYGQDIVVRLDPGDEILASLKEVCEKENVQTASVQGIGATNRFKMGVYDLEKQEYKMNVFQETAEITALVGNVTRNNGEVYLHLHMTVGDLEGRAIGGHLNEAYISVTGEIVMHLLDAEVTRKQDPQTGLNIFQF